MLQLAEHSNQNLRNMALDALDQSIYAVLDSERFQDHALSRPLIASKEVRSFSSSFFLRIENSVFCQKEECCCLSLTVSLSLCKVEPSHMELRSLECAVISPLRVLYFSTENFDVRVGSLKILLHVLEVIYCNTKQTKPLINKFYNLFPKFIGRDVEKNCITVGQVF